MLSLTRTLASAVGYADLYVIAHHMTNSAHSPCRGQHTWLVWDSWRGHHFVGCACQCPETWGWLQFETNTFDSHFPRSQPVAMKLFTPSSALRQQVAVWYAHLRSVVCSVMTLYWSGLSWVHGDLQSKRIVACSRLWKLCSLSHPCTASSILCILSVQCQK